MTTPAPVRLRLLDLLRARLVPLALLLVVVTCLSAPFAFFVLGRRALAVQAEATARQVAEVVRGDVQQRPRLWQYDTPKLLAHIRAYELIEGVARVEVVDAGGRPIDGGSEHGKHEPAIWGTAPIEVSGNVVGAVWVAASMGTLQRDTLILLAVFGVLGAAIGGLTYALPMQAMRRAESEIEALLRRLGESQAALATLNESLELQVETRSSELQQALESLRGKEQNLRELSARAVKLQEAERRGIARELHDSAGQSLTAIRIHLQLMTDLLGTASQSSLLDLARRTIALVDATMEEIRRAVNRLGPAVLGDVGLEAAVARASDDLAEATDIEVVRKIHLPEPLDASVETTCYRLIQEGLTNVARHAEASRVDIELAPSDRGGLELRLEDDGRGFDVDAAQEGRRGLVGMRERVELLGGELSVESAPGHGTRIRAFIPTGEHDAREA